MAVDKDSGVSSTMHRSLRFPS